jgi:transposase
LQEIAGDVQPHYTSIAAFVAKMHQQIEPLFTQVQMICDEEGLIGRNLFAIDGCKLKSNVKKSRVRSIFAMVIITL